MTALMGLALTMHAREAEASLISPNVIIDNPLQFRGTIDVPTFSVQTFTFSSVNWFVSITEDFIGSEALPNDFRVIVQHLVAVGPGEAAPNPASFNFVFFANSFTPGGPARGPFAFSVAHAPDALDFLTVSYNPVVAEQLSRITIDAVHAAATAVPEPATISLIAGGLLLGARRRRATRLARKA